MCPKRRANASCVLPKSINELSNVDLKFPIIADPSREVSLPDSMSTAGHN